ncbi:MAG: hypothetical protein M1819_006039 [Sarea resinae]|nr:MAG: hypothetical protein M1819_006039 [Sarea resinae]
MHNGSPSAHPAAIERLEITPAAILHHHSTAVHGFSIHDVPVTHDSTATILIITAHLISHILLAPLYMLLSILSPPQNHATDTVPAPTTPKNAIKTYPPPPSTAAAHKDPISLLTASQLSLLDPTGARTQLFSRTNPEAAKVGDILLVRQKNGDPFAGVCLNIRRRGVDSGILLRNELTRIGVEMWFKVYSPNVEGIEVVQRREKRARRARLYYMRQPKHSVGSVQNLVLQYQRQKAMLRSGDTRAAGSGSQGPGNTSQSKKGKKNKKR